MTWLEVDLSPMNSFQTTALTAAMPLPTIYSWPSCDYRQHYLTMPWITPIFLISGNDDFSSGNRQRGKHQNVRIRSNESMIKKNSDKLLTRWPNTPHMLYRSMNSSCHRQHLFLSLFLCKTSSKASTTKMWFKKTNRKTRLWITADHGVHTWISLAPSPRSHLQP